MTEMYRRAVFVGPRQIRFDELPIPDPGPRQALVRVRACALCTWEQRSYTGEESFYPLASGHEVAGELVKLGDQMYANVQIGDRVAALTRIRCGYCEPCQRGMDNICDNAHKRFRDGGVVGPAGLAEYVLIEDYQLYRASSKASFEEICLSEPLACVVRSVRQSRVERTDVAVVVGAGIMGILHLMLLKQVGARVIVSEINSERAVFAQKLGADAVIDPNQGSFVDQVRGFTNGRGADVIFCAVSVAAAAEQAVEAVTKGGRVHIFSSVHPRGTKISVDPNLFHGKEIVLSGTMSQNRNDARQAVGMISEGAVDLKPLISAVFPLGRLEEALETALQPDTYRVIVTP